MPGGVKPEGVSEKEQAMKLRLLLWALLAAGGGCKHATIAPMPGLLPSTGMLMRTTRIPLSSRLELRRYELLNSDVGNEFYPFNISRAKPVDTLASKLFAWKGWAWQFQDFVEMPRAEVFNAANVSPDGRRVVYERPDVTEGEGEWPRAYSRDRRTRRVAIRHLDNGQRFLLDCYTEMYGLGRASHWRHDGAELAFTTTCVKGSPHVRQLVVLDACGRTLLDVATMKELEGLEFISYSPKGSRIAALRPIEPNAGGRSGGMLVEVDLEKRTVANVAEVAPLVGCKHVDQFEKLIKWDKEGRCRLKP
ncbi:MAG: hypothetical protein AMJ81_08775 [Phycisphaerae bacterium SM23_33]|nr:MAG: hypothetical protein AMJ81_08775 [Phycisphaerae bacterium SM23_33]